MQRITIIPEQFEVNSLKGKNLLEIADKANMVLAYYAQTVSGAQKASKNMITIAQMAMQKYHFFYNLSKFLLAT